MSNTGDFDVTKIDFKWVDNENSVKRLRKAHRLLVEDGG